MTTDRLDQIEALLLQLSTAAVRHDNQLSRIEEGLGETRQLVEANAQAIAASNQAIEVQRVAHDELIRDTIRWFGDFAERFDQHQETIVEMQSEIRGLQTESRRIWEHLERRNGAG